MPELDRHIVIFNINETSLAEISPKSFRVSFHTISSLKNQNDLRVFLTLTAFDKMFDGIN